jgi:uncharacterized protein YndB with AHSA1/START domain
MSEWTINTQRILKASPEKVFDLWTKAEFIRQWFGGLETEVEAILFDLRPGGRYSIKVRGEDGPTTISGEFLEVDPPKRLVYTWQVTSSQGEVPSTTVEVEFKAKGDQTQVVLSHGPFLQSETKAFHSDGWQACFAAIESIITD